MDSNNDQPAEYYLTVGRSGFTSQERLQALFNILQRFRNQNEKVDAVLNIAEINTVAALENKLFEPTVSTSNQNPNYILKKVYSMLTTQEQNEMDEFAEENMKGFDYKKELGGSKLKKSKSRKSKKLKKSKSRKSKKH